MSALPEIVLNTAADPALLEGWVTNPLGLTERRVQVELDPPQVRVAWGPQDRPVGTGYLQVEGAGAGASTAALRVEFTGDRDRGPTVDGGTDPAARMLDALAMHVDETLNPD
jgi:hypothetical protein